MSFNYQDYSEEAINSMIDKGGRAKETISRENSVLNSFANFVDKEESVENLDALWRDKGKLDSILAKYFFCFRLKNGELPKKNTVEQYKSFLKNLVFITTSNALWTDGFSMQYFCDVIKAEQVGNVSRVYENAVEICMY